MPDKKQSTASAADAVIAHYNTHHTLSLLDFLAHYCHVPLDWAADPATTSVQIISLTTEAFVMEYTAPHRLHPTKAMVPFVPPLTTLAGEEGRLQATQKLAAMAKEAAQARGFAPAQVTTYAPPAGVLEFVIMLGTLANIPSMRTRLFSYLPESVTELSIIKAIEAYPWALFGTVMGIHAVEAVVLMRPLVQKWRVPGWNLKLRWYAASVMEGFPAIKRFKAEARRAEKRNAV